MPHPTAKKQRLNHDAASAAVNEFLASFDDLSVDVLATIFKFLPLEEIMGSRCLNKKAIDAIKITTVPLGDFFVNGVEPYNGMLVMTTEMPNLQQITIGGLGYRHKYSDGEDPNERRAAMTSDYTTHDIEIISNFRKLRILTIDAPLNGRYPVFFDSFPLLQKLSIDSYYLKWDLEMLAGFPVLKELHCAHNYGSLTGSINSLRVLKDTLEKVTIGECGNVGGKFMDLADFPQLKELYLEGTAVTGDIRDISENDFSSLEQLLLPKGVYGGKGYELQRISDAPDLVRTLYRLKQQRPALSMLGSWYAQLSEDSPDWYETVEEDGTPPFNVCFVQAGSRIGYRWQTRYHDEPCEVNWLDPEPESDSGDYEKYTEELQRIERQVRTSMCQGFHQPPTEEEYHRLLDEHAQRG